MQTVLQKTDCAVQCSLLPAPPLSFNKPSLDDAASDSEDETDGTVDESDTDYPCDDTEETSNESNLG